MKQQCGYYCLSKTSAKIHRDFIYLSSANVNRHFQTANMKLLLTHTPHKIYFFYCLFVLFVNAHCDKNCKRERDDFSTFYMECYVAKKIYAMFASYSPEETA